MSNKQHQQSKKKEPEKTQNTGQMHFHFYHVFKKYTTTEQREKRNFFAAKKPAEPNPPRFKISPENTTIGSHFPMAVFELQQKVQQRRKAKATRHANFSCR